MTEVKNHPKSLPLIMARKTTREDGWDEQTREREKCVEENAFFASTSHFPFLLSLVCVPTHTPCDSLNLQHSTPSQ